MLDDHKVTPAVASPATASSTGAPGNAGFSDSGSEGSGTGSTATEEMMDVWYHTDFGVQKSLRYHAKRRSFFDGSHRVCMAVNAIGGGGAFAAILGRTPEIAAYAAFFVAVASAADTAFGLSATARKHDRLYQQFGDLSAAMARIDIDRVEPAQIRDFRARRLLIEKEETTNLDALNVICHNEIVDAWGYGTRYKISRLQVWFAQLLTFPNFDPKAVQS